MLCKTQQQADRVAFFGARKMTEKTISQQGYTRIRLAAFLPKAVQFAFRIVNPLGLRYTVNIGDKPTCTCAFYKENAKWAICKHITYLRQERDADVAEEEYQQYEAERIAKWEAEEEEKADAHHIIAAERADADERYGMRTGTYAIA